MNQKELADLLVTSSQHPNQAKFVPWWVEDYENFTYKYNIFPQETVRDAQACLAECSGQELLSPAGSCGLTLFHLSVWHNFYPAVEQMLEDGRINREEVNQPDHKGHGLTPFLLACLRGNLAMVKLLLAHGADSCACDKRKMNAYHFLAYPRFEGLSHDFTCLERSVEQRREIVRILNCDINQKDEKGFTPLEHLLSTDYSSSYTWPLAEIFLENGAATDYVDENGNTLLMMALRNSHKTAALALMKQCPEMLHKANKQGVTPLAHAVSFRNEAMYIALTDHGAVPGDQDHFDLFPLSQITSNSFSDIRKDNRDALSLALFLTRKLLCQLDPDDDDDLGEITYILHNALNSDEEAHVLQLCKEAGFDFTMPVYYHGEAICLRDKCLLPCYGTGVIHKLIELGVDMNEAVVRGQTPANLIARKDSSNDSSYEAYFEEAAALFSRESMEQLDNSGEAAVHLAARKGHTGMLKVMIEKGVDINLAKDAPAPAGITPLHEACAYGQIEAAKLLIAAGANDTLKNLDGETPAHTLLIHKPFGKPLNTELQAQLLRELKHLDIARNDGKTPLLLLTFRDEELASLLLERGVDVNHADNNGMTAMMLNPDKDIIKLLLKAGADLSLTDNDGNTVLHYALMEYAESAARYLIKKGADYNRPNNSGQTPAQIAIERGYESVLALMTDIR
ncbi:MAG: hypothetical protein HFI38_13725 [Lachnospiraceae bacterium]|jgi:ankyrin repeat protein|nr:hypothetical protein [Lachnospiraceae bacterium]